MTQSSAHGGAGRGTPNRLAGETSPYLLQHQYNPVDWYPWGEEALDRARREDKPLLLSVGYSACHWCHVMERESFEDPDIARLMNERFVNVKVDREERPDIDAIYMQAVQAMTGHGGWPMTVFLTPEGVPFYGGTYFPPADRHGMPGFPRVLEAVAEFYREKRGEATQVGRELLERLRQGERVRAAAELLTPSLLDTAYQGLRAEFDPRHGGLGRAPKFPQPMAFDFLLRYWRRRDAAGCAPHGAADADADGPRRHLRPAGRRVPPLLGRPGLAGARTSRRCSTTRPSWRSSTSRPGRRRAIPSTAG